MGKKIVLAEDNTALLLLLKFTLEDLGHEVLLAEDGKQALELIEKNNPDLLLTDIMMPFVNGLEVIDHTRNKFNMEIPIIVFSYAGQEDMLVKAFNLGANDFIGKPFSPNELVLRMNKLL